MDFNYPQHPKASMHRPCLPSTSNFNGYFKVRCLKDWLVVLEEFTAAVDPKVLQKMYDIATSDEYGFLFIDLKNNKFYRSFKSELKAN